MMDQIMMLTQMMTQTNPSTPQTATKEESSFDDLLSEKTQQNQTENTQDAPASESETTTPDKEEDTTLAQQAMVANLLIGQVTQPVVQEMTQENTAAQALQTMVQTDTSMQVSTELMVETVQTEGQAQTIQTTSTVQQTAPQIEEVVTTVEPVQQQTQTSQQVTTDNISTEIVQQTNVQQGENTQQQSQPDLTSSSKDVQVQQTDAPEVQEEAVTPLFEQVEATPMKVGEATPTLDTQAPDMDENLADLVKYSLKEVGDKVEIQLTPSNLGKITIELVQKDGTISLLVNAENQKTMSLLAQHSSNLESLLQDRMGQNVQVQVAQQQPQYEDAPQQQHQQNQQQQQHQQPSKDEQQSFIDQLRLGLFQLQG